jgi:hypothetical protein
MGLNEASDGMFQFFGNHCGLETPIFYILETPDSSKSPRGIRGFSLSKGNFTGWKVQGKVGGYRKYVLILWFCACGLVDSDLKLP